MKVAVTVAFLLVSPLTLAFAADAEKEPQLGRVDFPVDCTPAAQQQFTRAVAILHSFWYEEATKAFTAVTETDPNCAMGYWGVAMSHWTPLWGPPNQAALEAGSAAVGKALSIGGKTEREQGYIEAIASFYRDNDKSDHRTRSVAYQKAMEQLSGRHPEDREAAIFYALALDTTASPSDKTYTNQKQAAAILEKIFAEQPDHPGVAHYLIHSYDSAPLAEHGVAAAICYSKIAPAVPHALHMPSHIFTRLGQWQNSIESNRAAAAAGQAYAVQQFGEGVAWAEALHAMDYLEYAHLQLGQDGEAKNILDRVRAFRKAVPESPAAAYALAAVPARYALERRDWADAAQLTLPSAGLTWEKFPWTPTMVTFARALGAARTGNFEGAQNEIDRLQSARDALIVKDKYWGSQIEVQRRAAAAMLTYARGNRDEGIAQMRDAAEFEASMEKHPVTPGVIVPSRELLADLLLESDQPAQALVEYERTLAAEPGRLRSLYGAAQAADRSGDRNQAKDYYGRLAELGRNAGTHRAEIIQAKAYLEK